MSMDIKRFEEFFSKIYGREKNTIEKQIERYNGLLEKFQHTFNQSNVQFFSTPGRTEIGGNHTDHNLGRVLAAAVNLDSVAVAAPSDSETVNIYSEGYDQPFLVHISDLDVHPEEEGTTTALIRGIAARFKSQGYGIGGFNACCTSDVLPGSGLSSSASIEVLIGTIFNHLFNDGKVTPENIAKTGQYAENIYFGKPCGLMDQMACAVGGIVSIDFKDPEQPVVNKVNFNFLEHHYSLLVVDSGGSHADLTKDYASIPADMKSVANYFDLAYCRQLSAEMFYEQIKDLRDKINDRAILRTLHFLGDNERVIDQVNALESDDFQKFLSLVNESGDSSFKWLQNVYSEHNVNEQGVSLALALTEKYISEINEGACRVHGGGFAGTILVFLPSKNIDKYIKIVENVFGQGKVLVLDIRSEGTICLNPQDI